MFTKFFNPSSIHPFILCYLTVGSIIASVVAIMLFKMEKKARTFLENQLQLERAAKNELKEKEKMLEEYKNAVKIKEAEMEQLKINCQKLETQFMDTVKKIERKDEENIRLVQDSADFKHLLEETEKRWQSLPQELLQVIMEKPEKDGADNNNMATMVQKIKLWRKLSALYLDKDISKRLRENKFDEEGAGDCDDKQEFTGQEKEKNAFLQEIEQLLLLGEAKKKKTMIPMTQKSNQNESGHDDDFSNFLRDDPKYEPLATTAPSSLTLKRKSKLKAPGFLVVLRRLLLKSRKDSPKTCLEGVSTNLACLPPPPPCQDAVPTLALQPEAMNLSILPEVDEA